MTQSMLGIFVRTVERKMKLGESLEDILAGYTKLSEEDKQQIREAVESDNE